MIKRSLYLTLVGLTAITTQLQAMDSQEEQPPQRISLRQPSALHGANLSTPTVNRSYGASWTQTPKLPDTQKPVLEPQEDAQKVEDVDGDIERGDTGTLDRKSPASFSEVSALSASPAPAYEHDSPLQLNAALTAEIDGRETPTSPLQVTLSSIHSDAHTPNVVRVTASSTAERVSTSPVPITGAAVCGSHSGPRIICRAKTPPAPTVHALRTRSAMVPASSMSCAHSVPHGGSACAPASFAPTRSMAYATTPRTISSQITIYGRPHQRMQTQSQTLHEESLLALPPVAAGSPTRATSRAGSRVILSRVAHRTPSRIPSTPRTPHFSAHTTCTSYNSQPYDGVPYGFHPYLGAAEYGHIMPYTGVAFAAPDYHDPYGYFGGHFEDNRQYYCYTPRRDTSRGRYYR